MLDVRVAPAREFGAACLAALREATAGASRPVVGLPTGNTPIALFESLRAAVESGHVDVSGWQPFAIDEYGGPRDHPCSNRAFFARYWDVIPGAPTVEQFDPEAADAERECQRIGRALAAAGGLTVALLGIGPNGHLAFNEPGSPRDSTVRPVDLHEASRMSAQACWGDAAPHRGLTLGLRELLGAGRVILMANGAAKAEIVRLALEGPVTVDLPASLVRELPGAVVVLDEAAAPRA